jgi:hypothetical protein
MPTKQIANGVVEPEVIDAPSFDKGRWLTGPSDIQEDELYVESLETWVKVRGLTAGEQATITDRCLEVKSDIMKVNTQQMSTFKFAAGVREPKFTEQEANVICHKMGPSFKLVVAAIEQLSSASEEDVAKARARFRPRR